jgi:CheY-like chemotaxis protein
VVEDNLERISFFKTYLKKHECFFGNTADESISLLKQHEYFEVIFLDHDLGDRIYVSSFDQNTGYTVAKWLCSYENNKFLKSNIIVHSMNETGAKNIVNLLDNWEFPVQYVPFNVLRSIIYLILGD